VDNFKRQFMHLEAGGTGGALSRQSHRIAQATSLPRERVPDFQSEASKCASAPPAPPLPPAAGLGCRAGCRAMPPAGGPARRSAALARLPAGRAARPSLRCALARPLAPDP
jgi:hypothetical protein